jgi:hypothetical protein
MIKENPSTNCLNSSLLGKADYLEEEELLFQEIFRS